MKPRPKLEKETELCGKPLTPRVYAVAAGTGTGTTNPRCLEICGWSRRSLESGGCIGDQPGIDETMI